METQTGERRTKRAVKVWMEFKKYYDADMPVAEILKKVKKRDGSKYSRGYFYKALGKLDEYLSRKDSE